MVTRTRWGSVVAVGVAAAIVGGCRARDTSDGPRATAWTYASADPYRAALIALHETTDEPPEVAAAVAEFYAARDYALAWHDRRGHARSVNIALDILRAAETHGLRADWYGLDALSTRPAAPADREATVRHTAALDRDLTVAVWRLGRDVATGRQRSSTLDTRWNSRRVSPDIGGALASALDAGQAAAFLDRVRPVHPEYHALQAALASLRTQVGRGWPLVPTARLRAGARHPAVPALRERLTVAGYLTDDRSADPQQFGQEVAAALGRFQEHHGLRATRILDRPTLMAMNVPLQRRIAEVELNLERWRWLPDDLGARHLLVNIPQFQLFVREGGAAVTDIRVVVGKRGNETPTFSGQMRQVVFSPYWNIPETIALAETIPAVARDPNYLARQNLEVRRAGGDVVPQHEIPWDDDRALRRLSFRQRPGPRNALGLVKFLFPNEHNVYLHDTPADALFSRVSRAFSHGCVRVEEPEALAAYLLRDRPEWTMEAVVAAMRSGTERHVPLTDPLPVHIVYFTAVVDPQGGLHHYQDVYGYDARSLRRPARSSSAASP